MSKYTKLNEPVFVNKITHQEGKDSSDIIEIQMTGIKSRNNYKTWLDPKFANWRNWEVIIESADDKGVVLSNLKFKDEDKGLINADSRPKIEYIVTMQELVDELADFWQAQKEYTSKFGPV